jgi:hypothetical protein
MAHIGSGGRLILSPRDTTIHGDRPYALHDIIISFLATMATHPKALQRLMSLEEGKTYRCHTWTKPNKRNRVSMTPCMPHYLPMQSMIAHYMGGHYTLNYFGKLVQDIIKKYEDQEDKTYARKRLKLYALKDKEWKQEKEQEKEKERERGNEGKESRKGRRI